MMVGDDHQQQDDQVEPAMVRGENFTPPPLMNVEVSEDLLATHVSRDKKTLFWVPAGVQDRTVWALIDTGASRNLISQQVYEAMPHPPELRPPGDMKIVAGNNQEIPLLGWITLRFNINTRTAYQEFGVAKNLPLDMIIGGEFLRSHDCRIMYQESGRDAFGNKDGSCEKCVQNKEKLQVAKDPQLQFSAKRTPAKRRNLSCVVVPTRLPEEQERRRENL